MNEFLRFYRWAMNMKLYMAINSLALIFFKAFCVLITGGNSLNIWEMAQMILVGLAVALLQVCLFPEGKDLSGCKLIQRTVAWVAGSNLLFIGGAVIFGWFRFLPLWANALLLVTLEIALFFLWLGFHLALKADTQQLNHSLQAFQRKK